MKIFKKIIDSIKNGVGAVKDFFTAVVFVGVIGLMVYIRNSKNNKKSK